MAPATKYAVVTGSNKGIGYETVKQLASNGITVVLAARDEKRGLEAVQKLNELGLSGKVVFHQLDVTDSASIASFADFVKTQFGKLDILINNAGILGITIDIEAIRASGGQIDPSRAVIQTYELTELCLKTNYYGPKTMIESLAPLLQLSDSPTIVNVSSYGGKLENIANEWAKEVLGDGEKLKEERVEEVLIEFCKDFKEGSLESKGWPTLTAAYKMSKAALNAYTRIAAKKYESFCVNCVCPGFVKTDLNRNQGNLTVEEGAESPSKLALLPKGGPSGLFFMRDEVSVF
ncbi:(+)-neomenthol dehydrogenase-like [Tripterygium wilfordii]|uniref:(+)-neomenthol dehydrogenase-like n=1 Tax=Tripterygium wilfordii TaxID=458696 RepID=UPI0018F7F4A8|nr:(+)-neomenthol dehydrogenase-like [Tripterygium wilfordii]XP_038682136.1 (+)-neomenthol dehydrogenase-like [Tripterygium wilfordii]